MSYRKGFKLLSPLFSLSTLKSVFGREDESAMLTRNTKCGKKSGIRHVPWRQKHIHIHTGQRRYGQVKLLLRVNGVSQIT